MCFKPKMPKVNFPQQQSLIQPEPLKEGPKGIEFGGDSEEEQKPESFGRKTLKVNRKPVLTK